jgi:hypothetical protein
MPLAGAAASWTKAIERDHSLRRQTAEEPA